MKVKTIPGSMPAAKSLPMDTSASTPKIIIRILGGMGLPREPEQENSAVENFLSYPSLIIPGSTMVPMETTVATLDPEIAANMAQDRTAAMPSPPVTPAVRASENLESRLATPALAMILLSQNKKRARPAERSCQRSVDILANETKIHVRKKHQAHGGRDSEGNRNRNPQKHENE